jgi:hypothetical protein
VARELEFGIRDSRGVVDIPLWPIFKSVFAMLAPGRQLPEHARAAKERLYNWGTDEEYFTAEGDGLYVADRWFGALRGDGIETHYELRIRDEIVIGVVQMRDSIQDTFTFSIGATLEAIDVVTDALIQVAEARKLGLVRRSDRP